jgi:uncharacterized protein (DUF1501 family)
MTHLPSSRRHFLRQATALASLGTGVPLALNLAAVGAAAAQTASGYKALVCLYLGGGNDTFNTLLATDTASWSAYTGVRQLGSDPIALRAPGTAPVAGAAAGSPDRLGGVLPLNPLTALPGGRSLALHPLLGSMATMFNVDRRLAVVSNVGPLLVPTTKAQVAQPAHPKPPKLFSHNDQSSTWLSGGTEGSVRGWGGRLADRMLSANQRAIFTAVSSAGTSVWLAGEQVRPYAVGTSGATRMGIDTSGRIFGSADVGAALQRIATTGTGHVLRADHAAVSRRSIEAEADLRALLPAANTAPYGTPGITGADPLLQYDNPLTGGRSSNGLAVQLQIVARMIGAASALGTRRQVFYVNLGGFDTHDNQNRNHADLMARLAHGLKYFDDVLGALGLRDAVTTFTASDFGRTFTSNGDGTDHGWGAHHFVMGGAVRGGQVYGQIPVLAAKNANNNNFDGSPDQLGNGALLPSTSVDQYAATMARWFGATETDLTGSASSLFPRLSGFGSRDLGFMVV